MYFLIFLSSILGALIAPIFSFPKFVIFLPFLFFKKREYFWILFFFLVLNILSVVNFNGDFEFVGRVIQTNDNYSLVKGDIFYDGKWEKLNVLVGVNKEIPLGDIVYYYGPFDAKKYSYPKVTLDKNRVIVSPYFSLVRNIYTKTENFREKILEYSEIYYGLFGGKVKDKIYSDSGLYHFFSISGLHISLIFAILTSVLTFFSLSDLSKKVIALMVSFLFLISCGNNLPSLRAFLYLFLVILFEKLFPKMSKIDILSFVGLFFLFFQPFLAYSLSFYMTFFSTFGILSVENNKLKPLAAFLGCAPFLSLFSNVNVFSIIGTLVLIIPFQIILISLMIAYFFYILNFSLVVDFILKVNLPITNFIEFISSIFSRFPKIPGGIITYFLFSLLFFAFLLHFGQIPYILKSKSSN